MLNIAEVIGRAREYLEKHGWIQDELREGEKVCSYGGLLVGAGWLTWDDYEEDTNVVLPQGQREMDLFPVATHLLVYGIGIEPNRDQSPINQIVSWNDAEGRDKQEVLDAFAKAEKVAIAGFDPDAA